MSINGDRAHSPPAVAPDAVTRRDFVGGTLVGAGATLLGMAAPAALRPAQAQTLPVPMTGLGPGLDRAGRHRRLRALQRQHA